MSFDAAHKNHWTIAEVVFGLPFLLSLIVHWVVPLSLPLGPLSQALIPVGILLIIAGMSLVVSARREFARCAQPTDPGQPTSKVIKTGVFAISRNPLYLGCAFIFLGIALTFNTFWTLAALLLSIILCHYLLILPEERYLTAKFGREYEAYTAATRRWLGRRRTMD